MDDADSPRDDGGYAPRGAMNIFPDLEMSPVRDEPGVCPLEPAGCPLEPEGCPLEPRDAPGSECGALVVCPVGAYQDEVAAARMRDVFRGGGGDDGFPCFGDDCGDGAAASSALVERGAASSALVGAARARGPGRWRQASSRDDGASLVGAGRARGPGRWRQPPRGGAAPSPRLGLLETLVGSLERWRGQDLVDTDPRVGAVADTQRLRLEAAASVAGAAPGRVRPGAGPLGRATASVTLSGSHDELLRTYAFRGGRRRRPMIVLAVDDPCLERALREYVDAHRVCEELGCDVAERPRLVLTTERATRGDVDHLQRQLRLLAKRAAVSGDAALRAAVEGVFLTDPSAVVRGVARDVSQDLLAAVVKSAAHTGHRLLRHLAARDETFTIRVHRASGGDASPARRRRLSA